MTNYLLVAGLAALLLSWLFWPNPKPRPMELLRSTKLPYGEYLLTVRMPSGLEELFRGGGTVYRCYPSGNRCSARMEHWLSNRVAAIRWQEETP